MTREEFLPIAKLLRSVYKDFLTDEDTINSWYELLKDMDVNVLKTATIKYMQTQKFPPFPADLRGQITSKELQLSPEAAWHIVDQALWSCTSFKACEEVFETFPEAIKAALGSAGTLYGYTQEEAGSVQKALFLKAYKDALNRAITDSRMSPTVRAVVDKIESYEQVALPVFEAKPELPEPREPIEIDPRFQKLADDFKEYERTHPKEP